MRVFYIGTHTGQYHPHDTAGQLHDLQAMVGGFIEVVCLTEFTDQGILLLANEEGLLAQLEVNENMWPYFLVGPIVALGVDGENFTGLSEAQQEFIQYWLENQM